MRHLRKNICFPHCFQKSGSVYRSITYLSIYLLIYLSSLSSPIPSIPPSRKYKKTWSLLWFLYHCSLDSSAVWGGLVPLRWGSWDLAKVSDLFKDPQLVGDWPGVRTKISWFPVIVSCWPQVPWGQSVGLASETGGCWLPSHRVSASGYFELLGVLCKYAPRSSALPSARNSTGFWSKCRFGWEVLRDLSCT